MTAPLHIALLDLGVGNLRSVERAFQRASEKANVPVHVSVTTDPAVVRECDRLVVPGQGAFRDGSRSLQSNLGEAIRSAIAKKKPYFGICLGLQLLFEESEEAPGFPGLGIFSGRSVRLCSVSTDSGTVRIPHMGWNQLEFTTPAPPRFPSTLGDSPWFYFVHSYHALPHDPSLVTAVVTHGPHRITAAIGHENIIATQFHPEKSQDGGLSLLADFIRIDHPLTRW